ncbi:MAG: hypothetical protein PHS57_00435 [Alphaproteobacteria bacterium]|nr:hypothetical protein [Alphaproteobacteria bacterium]
MSFDRPAPTENYSSPASPLIVVLGEKKVTYTFTVPPDIFNAVSKPSSSFLEGKGLLDQYIPAINEGGELHASFEAAKALWGNTSHIVKIPTSSNLVVVFINDETGEKKVNSLQTKNVATLSEKEKEALRQATGVVLPGSPYNHGLFEHFLNRNAKIKKLPKKQQKMGPVDEPKDVATGFPTLPVSRLPEKARQFHL